MQSLISKHDSLISTQANRLGGLNYRLLQNYNNLTVQGNVQQIKYSKISKQNFK